MNYVIEDGIDFSQLLQLNDEDEDNYNSFCSENNKQCLLTGEPLDLNHITLSCQHSFNYKPLYNEILSRKFKLNKYSRPATHLKVNQIECPYCRNITNKLIPYCPLISGVSKIVGVNSPKKYTIQQHTCSHIFKSGKNKGTTCKNTGFFYKENGKVVCLCSKHWQYQQKTNLHKSNQEKSKKKIKLQSTKPTLTKLEDSLNKKYRVVDLKNILRENKEKLSGNKYDLIKRVILKKLY